MSESENLLEPTISQTMTAYLDICQSTNNAEFTMVNSLLLCDEYLRKSVEICARHSDNRFGVDLLRKLNPISDIRPYQGEWVSFEQVQSYMKTRCHCDGMTCATMLHVSRIVGVAHHIAFAAARPNCSSAWTLNALSRKENDPIDSVLRKSLSESDIEVATLVADALMSK